MSVTPRSERIALEELRLREWCKVKLAYWEGGPAENVGPVEGWITNIGFIHSQIVSSWVNNPTDPREYWTDYDLIPPWNPTLSSVEGHMRNDLCVQHHGSWDGRILQLLQYGQHLSVDSLDSPLLPEHISHITSLYDEFEAELDNEFDDEFDFDDDDEAEWPIDEDPEVYLIQNLQPRRLFQDDVTKELCKKGLELLSDIMEKAKDIDGIQGNYLELCNIFKEIHNN
jgi:hypothetical protein